MPEIKSYIDENGDARELDEYFFKHAKRGRPPMPSEQRKQRVNIMLDPDIIARLKEGGKGWQTRLNATLREALGL
ncbi:MAG: BrnA antitoxin family protein [Alphaproteobacteria bacterium]|nr:BrnA antitoxin family protein [Alphaproteobacteria bacterium]